MNEQMVHNIAKDGCYTNPSSADELNVGESTDAAARYCSFTWIPATDTVSVYMLPCTVELSTYLMVKCPGLGLDEVERLGSYLCLVIQTELSHVLSGTQRSEEPVSKLMMKGLGGVPMVAGPVHSEFWLWSVSCSEPLPCSSEPETWETELTAF